MSDVSSVGGKCASLGEMYQNLSSLGVSVPNGFATTAAAYREFLAHGGLGDRIWAALASLDVNDTEARGLGVAKSGGLCSLNLLLMSSERDWPPLTHRFVFLALAHQALHTTGKRIRDWIMAALMPKQLEEEVVAAYRELCGGGGDTDLDVAVRSRRGGRFCAFFLTSTPVLTFPALLPSLTPPLAMFQRAAQLRRTSPTPPLRGSRTRSSTSAAPRPSSPPSASSSPPSLTTAQSPTGSPWRSRTTPSPCPSASSGWSARTSRFPGSSSPATQSPGSGTPWSWRPRTASARTSCRAL